MFLSMAGSLSLVIDPERMNLRAEVEYDDDACEAFHLSVVRINHFWHFLHTFLINFFIEAMGYKSGKLFEVPIGSHGKVVVTSLAERVYMIMWNSAPDNRLTTVSTFHPSQNIHCMTDDAYSPSAMPFTLRWTFWHSSILMAW